MNTMWRKISSFGLLLIFLSGCATQREDLQIPQSFFSQSDSIVIIAKEGLNKPDLYLRGNQGIIDYFINGSMMSEVIEKMASIPHKKILNDHYFEPFKKYFEEKHFKVIVDFAPLSENLLKVDENANEKTCPYKTSFLKKKYNVNYALILDTQAFGIIRKYYGFIPLNSPQGYTRANFFLVNLNNNKVIATSLEEEEQFVSGEWDNPPDFVDLLKAVEKSLQNALNSGYDFLAR